MDSIFQYSCHVLLEQTFHHALPRHARMLRFSSLPVAAYRMKPVNIAFVYPSTRDLSLQYARSGSRSNAERLIRTGCIKIY